MHPAIDIAEVELVRELAGSMVLLDSEVRHAAM